MNSKYQIKSNQLLDMQNYIGSYEKLIVDFLDRGYYSIKFPSLSSQKNQLIIRHDIDFDCSYAHQMSLIENKIGVKSTYFFMLCSESYNLLSSENINYIKKIQASGHTISLHFDPTIYNDFNEGFRYEVEIFERVFNEQIDIISIHRPNQFFINYDRPINGIDHTYQNRYLKEITYISDSQGAFRFGHPHDSLAFQENNTIHLLTHPIWWMCSGNSNVDVLEKFVKNRHQSNVNHIANNCIPYQKYLGK